MTDDDPSDSYWRQFGSSERCASSLTYFISFFIIIILYLPSPFPPKSCSKTEDIAHKCLSRGGKLPVLEASQSLQCPHSSVSPCVAVPYHLLAHTQAIRASVWAVRHLPGPWESFCIYRVHESRGGKDLQGQLSCVSSPLLLCAKSGSVWWLLLKTPSSSFQRPPCRSLIPGTLIYAGGQECARRAPWLSSLVENLVQTAVTSQ